MTVSRETLIKLLLTAISFAVFLILSVAVIEVYMQLSYNQWRSKYDNSGWLNKVTVKSANPILMWEYRPHGEIVWDEHLIQINDHGFRKSDPPMNKARRDGIARIAVIGDSVTLGLGVGEQETLPAQLQLALNAIMRGKQSFEVLNFGVDGYNTSQVVELLRTRVVDYSPDVVVYALCPNDFDFEESAGEKIYYFRRPRSFVWRVVKQVSDRLWQIDYHHSHFYTNRETVYSSILLMREFTAGRGTQFLVARLPMFPEGSFDPYPIEDIDNDVKQFLDGNEIRHVDLLEPLRASKKSPSTLAKDSWHPTAEGHRIMAASLVQPVLRALRAKG